MQFALLTVSGAAIGLGMRRIVLWRRCGILPAARRLYTFMTCLLGGGALAAMLTQEAVLLFSGQLSWRNALPLHLCSVMGLIALPMLLTHNRLLWHISFYLGLPGALLALIFPAIQTTPWPTLTELAFHAMHCCIFLAPILPLSLGRRPSPSGAAWSFIFLLLLALTALGVNALTGGNYLFLQASPLPWLQQSPAAWRLTLTLLATATLSAEALLVHLLQRKKG